MEIKTVRALTERPEAEKGWKCRLLNGPRRARGKERQLLVFRDVGAYVSCQGYDGILIRACQKGVKQGGTAGFFSLEYPVLDRS